ncbi:MAG: GNAT family N-acetyltransferase [Bacteroidia bacterium]|nr:GNAT family N-acetyltransferase [Bacteroidia bacterium]
MKIIDISPETESAYFCCLEEWSEDMKEAGGCKQKWYESMKDRGLKVKFALDDNDIIGGMIQYIPSEYSICDGRNLYVVLCIWVHGHKQGRGDYRKRGMGIALLKSAEEDARQMGADGLVTWGLIIPVFMRASWFKKHGYKVVDKSGIMRLLWKPFHEKAIAPKFRKPGKKPEKGEGKVNLTMFRNGWCQSVNITCERAKRAALDFPGKIDVQEIDTTDSKILNEYGITDALFIDGKEVMTGPPISYEKIRKKIEKKVKKYSD